MTSHAVLFLDGVSPVLGIPSQERRGRYPTFDFDELWNVFSQSVATLVSRLATWTDV